MTKKRDIPAKRGPSKKKVYDVTPEGKNATGRPALWNDPEKMQEAIDKYFNWIKEENLKATITGLCLYLGFESRQSFFAYEAKPEFSYTIKRARTQIESVYEVMLHGTACAGAIFALKNFDWRDKQEVEHSGEIKGLNIVVQSEKDKKTIDEIG